MITGWTRVSWLACPLLRFLSPYQRCTDEEVACDLKKEILGLSSSVRIMPRSPPGLRPRPSFDLFDQSDTDKILWPWNRGQILFVFASAFSTSWDKKMRRGVRNVQRDSGDVARGNAHLDVGISRRIFISVHIRKGLPLVI